ncbi:alpha-L-fucosidase [Paraburkholderia acidicola]|uniref:alpha-L-fucosidase n=1 Tax=Paraburkholderia acidicola TaxID=1912599 RepID=UPI000BBB87B6|nr:alpha-L-fucosidase [Paraburkholderia acidicola]
MVDRRRFIAQSLALYAGTLLSESGVAETTALEHGPNPVFRTKAETLKWYENAKFGMMVCWGIYSSFGEGEWILLDDNSHFNNGTASGVDAYKENADKYLPTRASIRNLVSVARNAGAKYINLVTRHHDGYSLWNTGADLYASRYNTAVDGPRIDVVKGFADECSRQGLQLVLYYSLLDWTNPAFPTTQAASDDVLSVYQSNQGNLADYLAFMKAQLKELLTHYGQIAAVWFDGYWAARNPAMWDIEDIYHTINVTQPATLIVNNKGLSSGSAVLPGEDFAVYERGQNPTVGSFGETIDTSQTDAQANAGTWGYDAHASIQPVAWMLDSIITNISVGKNFVLNIGPMANGKLQSALIDNLAQVGRWMSENAEAIYDTQAGPVQYFPTSTSRTTASGREYVYLFVSDSSSGQLQLGNYPHSIKRASLVMDPNCALAVLTSPSGDVTIQLPGSASASAESPLVIKLQLG